MLATQMLVARTNNPLADNDMLATRTMFVEVSMLGLSGVAPVAGHENLLVDKIALTTSMWFMGMCWQ